MMGFQAVSLDRQLCYGGVLPSEDLLIESKAAFSQLLARTLGIKTFGPCVRDSHNPLNSNNLKYVDLALRLMILRHKNVLDGKEEQCSEIVLALESRGLGSRCAHGIPCCLIIFYFSKMSSFIFPTSVSPVFFFFFSNSLHQIHLHSNSQNPKSGSVIIWDSLTWKGGEFSFLPLSANSSHPCKHTHGRAVTLT